MTWQPVHRVRGFDACFGLYLRGLLRRSFARIAVRDGVLPSGGCIVAANHHSWWDGLIPYYVHHHDRRPQRFAVMMSEAQLRRFPYFRFGGAFSIDGTTVRRAAESLRYAAALARAGDAVWIFPDGALRAPSIQPAFSSGFVHAARYAAVPIVPAGMRFVMLAKQRPEAFIAFGERLDASQRDAAARAQAAVASLLRRIDEDVATGAADRYRVVLRGRAGADDTASAITARVLRR